MVFMCKKCRKAFRKDMTRFEESDEYCPHCDNHFIIEAKTAQAGLAVEGEDARVDARQVPSSLTLASFKYLSQQIWYRMLRDERVKRMEMSLDDAYAELLEP
ncbi:hypothetical protein FRC09_017349 [Ceratobasidium sp. 395]|nr:hypothetical protein FRC09_017349 [Ceratobasidium sp. 395]